MTSPKDPVRIDPVLLAYLENAPLSRALIRSREASLLAGLHLEPPILDIGYGDGVFADVMLRLGSPPDVGVDIDLSMLLRAPPLSRPRRLVADAARLPLRSGRFRSAMSNCVFEHLEDPEAAFREVARVLPEGGRFAITVVTDRWVGALFWVRFFRALFLHPLAALYARFVTRVFNHRSYLPEERWAALAARAGFVLQHAEPYVSPRRNALMDLFFPFALLAHGLRAVTGRYALVSRRHPRRFLAWADAREGESRGVNALLVFRKAGRAP